MFTPPPSPQPTPGLAFPAEDPPLPSKLSEKYLSPPPLTSSPSLAPANPRHAREDSKRRIGRRFRNAVILVPILLIAITVTARLLSCGAPSVFKSLDIKQLWPNLYSTKSSEKQPEWVRVEKREPHPQAPAPTSTTSAPPPATSSSPSLANQIAPTVPSTPPTLPTPFPQAFDGSLSQNFSSVSCMNFFTNMTNARPFRSCRPFSVLLQSSNTFISAQSNLTELNSLIWGTCNTSTAEDECISNMASFASGLKTQCVQDLKDNNANAVRTLEAINAYAVMRDAACLTDPTTNTYCFVNAARDTNPTNLYYYSLPLGLKIPGSGDPQCNACLKSLMGLYGTAVKGVGDKALPGLVSTYEKAAELTQGKCGSGYAQTNVVSAAGPGGVAGVSWEARVLASAVLGLWTLVGPSIF